MFTNLDHMPVRTIERVVFTLAFVLALAAIWALTVQTPDQTISLSSGWSHAIASITGLSSATASWMARKIAHTVEFFPVGLFLGLSAAAWFDPASGLKKKHLLIIVVIICFACSLGDQTHKLFVPGREFDALDMAFDAAGYLVGLAAAHFIVCKMVR